MALKEKKEKEEEGTKGKKEKKTDAGAVLSATAGMVAGGVATAGPAVSAGVGAAAGGLGAYGAGLGATIGAIGCEAAAIGTLGVILAGPVLGGLIAYYGYKTIKGMGRKDE